MRRRQNKRPRFRPNISWPPIWTAILSTVPLVTIFLTLIGYGYDVAYLEEFGLSPTMVQHGPLDFLLRSTYAMVAVIKFYNELAQLLGTIEGLQTIWARLSWASYGAMALSMLLTRPELMGAALVWHGRLVPQVLPHAAPADALHGRKLWVSHGTHDDVIPVASAQAICHHFDALPVQVTYREFASAHDIRPSELAATVAWLEGLSTTPTAF